MKFELYQIFTKKAQIAYQWLKRHLLTPDIHDIFEACEDLIGTAEKTNIRRTANYEKHLYTDTPSGFDNIHNIQLFSQFLGRQTRRQGKREESNWENDSEPLDLEAAISYLVAAEKLDLNGVVKIQRYVVHSQRFTDEEIQQLRKAVTSVTLKLTNPHPHPAIACP